MVSDDMGIEQFFVVIAHMAIMSAHKSNHERSEYPLSDHTSQSLSLGPHPIYNNAVYLYLVSKPRFRAFCLVLGVIACNNHYERSKLKSSMPMSFSTQDSRYNK
jgi:hypothetical protein